MPIAIGWGVAALLGGIGTWLGMNGVSDAETKAAKLADHILPIVLIGAGAWLAVTLVAKK